MKFRPIVLALLLLLAPLAARSASAQIPPPSGPVTFCGTQALPAATSYTVAVDTATPAPLTMAATVAAACPAGATHSFTLAASLFPIGTHQVVVRSINAFGTTTGPAFTVTVGIAPGVFTITALIPPAGE